MADLGGGIDHQRAVRIETKSRKIESEPLKIGSSNDVPLDFPVSKRKKTWRPDFTIINFKPEGAYRNSKYYRPKKYHNIRFDVEACRTDEEDLDQLVIRYGPVIQILRNNPTRKKKTQIVFRTLEPYITNDVQWSPLGSYLVSLDQDAATLWDIDGALPMLMCYEHPMVNLVDFSPGEKYLVTYNRPDPPNPSEFKIFDVETGRILMGGYDGVADVSWPVIRWAGGKDDSYFSIFSNNRISVYETQNFNLLPQKFCDVVDMCWSPAESILAVLKGCGKKSAKVSLVQIPEMAVLSEKDIDDVYDDCKMYWQSSGEYLAVKLGSLLVLFCIKEFGIIPSEVLKVKENILAFAWEPSGHRFAMIHGHLVSFYSMQTPGKVSELGTFNKQVDSLFWSPRGKHIVLAELKVSQFEFFDVDKLETMNKVEHLMATVIAWDPTGRYVATAYTISQKEEEGFKNGFHWIYSDPPLEPENGFFMWSFKGEKLYWKSAAPDYRLLQLNWRPYGGSIDEEMLKNLEKPLEESDSSEEECEDMRPNFSTEEECDTTEEECDNSASEEEEESE